MVLGFSFCETRSSCPSSLGDLSQAGQRSRMRTILCRPLNCIITRKANVFCYLSSSVAATQPQRQEELLLLGQSHPTDNWTNVTTSIAKKLPRKLHLNPSHPIGILRSIIETRFREDQYTHYSDIPPVVTVQQNFDSLNIPLEHPSRSRTDTYYVNADTVLRTHTSAHQAEIFRSCPTPGFLISGDVFRRDAIDKSHYPAFHQMEGARVWTRNGKADLSSEIAKDLASLQKTDLSVMEDTTSLRDPNLSQQTTSEREAEAISKHLKRTLEGVVQEIFGRAQLAMGQTSPEKLVVRWIDAYFPFTSPSYELEVFWQDQWLELLGCGVVSQRVFRNAGSPLINCHSPRC